MISVICPFYNEEVIIEESVRLMLVNLQGLSDDWELIVVDDGSTDESLEIVKKLEKENDGRLRVIGYETNRGRGHAIRKGVATSSGEIIVTTEIDSSWGDDIALRLVAELNSRPDADIIIASPNMPGGGYRNVPFHRVLLSRFGNVVIRSGLSYGVTMNTGMTRAYRRASFESLPLVEDGKEMHLEIVNKALAFGYRIYEIPAVLEWKTDKLSKSSRAKRKSSSNVPKLIRSHFLFSLLSAPFRYIYAISLLLLSLSAFFFAWAVVNFIIGEPSIFLLIISLVIGLFALTFFGGGVLAQQSRAIQTEMWWIRSEVRKKNERMSEETPNES